MPAGPSIAIHTLSFALLVLTGAICVMSPIRSLGEVGDLSHILGRTADQLLCLRVTGLDHDIKKRSNKNKKRNRNVTKRLKM